MGKTSEFIEHERRFLLTDSSWRPEGVGPLHLRQGYLKLGEQVVGRVERAADGSTSFVLDDKYNISISPEYARGLEQVLQENNSKWPPGWKARIRCTDNTDYVLDIKGPRAGANRPEFPDTPLARETGEALLTRCGDTVLEKNRYPFDHRGEMWLVDEYLDKHKGLVVLEVEPQQAGRPLELPSMAGEEITGRKLFGTPAPARGRPGQTAAP